MIDIEYQNYVKVISTLIPEKRIFTDTLRRLAYGTEGWFYRLEPQVVVRVSNEKKMQLSLQKASSRKLPVTFKVAGTSLSGQAISDSILLMAGEGWQEGAVAGFSNSRTCEIDCTEQFGIPYMSIMYLVDEVTTGVNWNIEVSIPVKRGPPNHSCKKGLRIER